VTDNSGDPGDGPDGGWQIPDYVYLSRWFPIRASVSPSGDIFLARLGVILIVCGLIAVLVRKMWS